MIAWREHFARVEPIVGPHLRAARVALVGLPAATPIITHLAACGVGRWLWGDDARPTACPERSEGTNDQRPTVSYADGRCGPDALQEYLLAQHGTALEFEITKTPFEDWIAVVCHERPDLIVAVGEPADLRVAFKSAQLARTPALLICPPLMARPCQAIMVFPDDESAAVAQWIESLAAPIDASKDLAPHIAPWDWTTAAPLLAGLARAILLRDTPYRRADLAKLWDAGMRVVVFGTHNDPFSVLWSAVVPSPCHSITLSPCQVHFRTPSARRGRLLIAGLGSLGSVAASLLADHVGALVLADPDIVDASNPVRQAYPLTATGRSKAWALRDLLCAGDLSDIVALNAALVEERAVTELIERHGVTAALVTTGTAADFAIARALRAHDVPHVVGRCYPRARYWEAIVVDGRRGPALGDLRGHLRPGPAPAPTPEQIAAYSDAGALEAEPATLIESGWAAAWMARLAAQLLAPAGLRERWLLELLAAEQTCIVGGVGVEPTDDGPAYGIALPGEIRAWGRDAILKT